MGTVTISGTAFDIYGTRAAADTYMSARLGNESWKGASSSDKDKSLVSGTRYIDRQNWQGQKTDLITPQPLEFPRTGLTDKDGNAVGSVLVPLLVEEANYEMALTILADTTASDNATSGSNIKAVRAGTAEVKFFRAEDGTKLPTTIHEMIGLWLDGNLTSASTGNLVTGDDGCSTFTDIDQWGRNRGFP